MQKVFRVTVDISKKIPAPAFEVNTNDLKSVKLEITITNGQSLLDLTDVTPRINIRKPDNEVIFQDCEIVDAKSGKVQIILENQAYLVPGTHTAEIACYKGSEITAITGTFSYKSIKGIMNDEAVESKSEFTAIDRKIAEARKLLEDIGENGVGVDEQARQEIQEVSAQLAEKVSKVNGKTPDSNGNVTIDVDTTNLATKTEVNAKLGNLADATPLFANDTNGMTDTSRLYVNLADGYLYAYNGSTFENTNVLYQATGSNDFPATNIVVNGDFSKQTGSLIDGWATTTSYGKMTIANNVGTWTVTVPHVSNRIEQNADKALQGHKYYSKCEINPKYRNETYFQFGSNIGKKYTPVANQWNVISSINTPNTDTRVRIYHKTDSGYVAGDSIQLRYVISLDLTVIFGEGNEPTLEEMDSLMASYPNHWFDGTVAPFFDNRRIYEISQKIYKEPVLNALSMKSKTTSTAYGSEISPAISGWTGTNGATWGNSQWSIPSGGVISSEIGVVSGNTYLVDIDISPVNAVGRLKLKFGNQSYDIFSGTDGIYRIAIESNVSGQIPIVLGDSNGTWTATVKNVSVKQVVSYPSMTAHIGELFPIRSYGNSIAVGGGHSKRTILNYNNAFGFESQQDLSTGHYNNAFGARTQQGIKNGGFNNAFGYTSQQYLVTGFYNNAYGYATQKNLTSGSWNNAFGNEAQISLTTGDNNVGMGRLAQFKLTTGYNNTGLGAKVQYVKDNRPDNATVTASFQTCIGSESGQSSAVQADNLTALGFQSQGTTNATALGTKASAEHVGSVAIGMDSEGQSAKTSEENDFVLGTEKHKVKVQGSFSLPRKTPQNSSDPMGRVGDILTDDNYVYVKTSSGWKRSSLASW